LQINDINLMLFLEDFHIVLVWRRNNTGFQFFLGHQFNIVDQSGIWIVGTFWLLGYALVDGLHEKNRILYSGFNDRPKLLN